VVRDVLRSSENLLLRQCKALDPGDAAAVSAHCVDIDGMKVLSICGTLFHGMNAAMISVLLHVDLAWAPTLLLKLPVRLSSLAALFRQRRYDCMRRDRDLQISLHPALREFRLHFASG
jgi:hypothetical protein